MRTSSEMKISIVVQQVKIWGWHCSGLGCSDGVCSSPGLETSMCPGMAKKNVEFQMNFMFNLTEVLNFFNVL